MADADTSRRRPGKPGPTTSSPPSDLGGLVGGTPGDRLLRMRRRKAIKRLNVAATPIGAMADDDDLELGRNESAANEQA